jgi:hypothetical protein
MAVMKCAYDREDSQIAHVGVVNKRVAGKSVTKVRDDRQNRRGTRHLLRKRACTVATLSTHGYSLPVLSEFSIESKPTGGQMLSARLTVEAPQYCVGPLILEHTEGIALDRAAHNV